MGVPVPAGFTITTDACRAYMAARELPEALEAEVDEHVRRLEERTGKRFGSSDDPLLVSVRSGAAVSMPGMMDTILNLGLNDAAAEGLAARTGNARFAFDSYRRLIQMFGEVVEGIDGHRFESALSSLKQAARCPARHRSLGGGSARARRDVQGDLPRGDGPRVRDRRPRPAAPGRARGLRVVGHAARAGLPACPRHSRRPRHRGQRRADGVRQQGRPLRDRCRVHARPVDRASRGSTASSSRTRRARTSSPGFGRRSRSRGCATCCRRRSTSWSRRCGASRSTTATCRTSSSRSRTSSSISCRRARRSARPLRR